MSTQADSPQQPEWMLPQELSELTGLTLKRLTDLRYERKAFPFHKVADSRVVLYDREEVNRIIREGRVEVSA